VYSQCLLSRELSPTSQMIFLPRKKRKEKTTRGDEFFTRISQASMYHFQVLQAMSMILRVKRSAFHFFYSFHARFPSDFFPFNDFSWIRFGPNHPNNTQSEKNIKRAPRPHFFFCLLSEKTKTKKKHNPQSHKESYLRVIKAAPSLFFKSFICSFTKNLANFRLTFVFETTGRLLEDDDVSEQNV
jgi:hypothetical protein